MTDISTSVSKQAIKQQVTCKQKVNVQCQVVARCTQNSVLSAY